MASEGLSKNKISIRIYGHKSTQTLAWVDDALFELEKEI